MGCWKTPFSTPAFRALLKSESNMFWVTVMLLLLLTYCLSFWRLVGWSAGGSTRGVKGGGFLTWNHCDP